MISWQRMLSYLGLAVVEATPPALLLTLAGGGAWGGLIGLALAGALADWIILRRMRPGQQRPALAAIGLCLALWLAKGQLAPGAGLLDGWGRAIGALFLAPAPGSGVGYLSLLAGLYCFWRGTRLTLHDTVSVHRLFRLAMVALILIVGLGFFGGGLRAAGSLLASIEVLSFFAVGLITIALAVISEEREAELRPMDWRGLLTLFGAIALVLALGLLVGSLVGDEAAAVVRLLWQGLVLVVALILAPFFYLAAAIVDRLLRLLNLNQLLNNLNFQPPQPPGEGSAATDLLAIFPAWAQALIRAFFALLPILVVVGLILLARRRARRAASADEERESLWSWGALAADLRGLLSNFGTPRRAPGLRDALARLRGADPATRVRRSYIRLLLLGQAHERPRAASQTPREYAPAASAMLPAASQPIEALTDTYERARYHPQSLGAADATAAEQAWAAIDRAGRGQGDKMTR